MFYVLFLILPIVFSLGLPPEARHVFLALVAALLGVGTAVTMLSSRLVSEPASFMSALRANILGYVAAAVVTSIVLRAAHGSAALVFLVPLGGFLAGTWAVSHALSLRMPYAMAICAINGVLVAVLWKTASFLPLARSLSPD